MTISLIIGVVVVAAVLVWIFFSGRKQSHHLDDLHITGTDEKKN